LIEIPLADIWLPDFEGIIPVRLRVLPIIVLSEIALQEINRILIRPWLSHPGFLGKIARKPNGPQAAKTEKITHIPLSGGEIQNVIVYFLEYTINQKVAMVMTGHIR
jgi:hypothetical protein